MELILIAQAAELHGISQLAQFGLAGVMLMLMIYAVIAIWKQNTTNLVDWRVEARADLKEERTSRQTHEAAMTKLLTELVAAVADIKDSLQIVLEELRRMKENGK
jgi:hypothetical protein